MVKNSNNIQFFNDRKKRWSFRQTEVLSIVTKTLTDSLFPSFNASLYLKSPFRNICLLTGSTKRVLTRFKLSRHSFRRNSLSGNLYGSVKSLW